MEKQKLTPLEKSFKYVFGKGWSPFQALQQIGKDRGLSELLFSAPEDDLAFRQIMQHIEDGESLDDELFFCEGTDVFMNTHPRYMPLYKHKHRFFELQYVISGTLRQTIGGQDLILYEGDVCFIAPETEHEISVCDDETVIVNILIRVETFRSVFMDLMNKEDIISDFFSRVLMCNSYYPYIYCRTENKEVLSAVVMSMMETYDSEMRLKNRLIITKLEEFFIYLLNDHEYDFITGSNIGETDRKILPILRYIQDHYKTVTLAQLSRDFNYSESYLSRIITLYTGSGFSQILKTVRLKHAAGLLETSHLSINDFSEQSGYEDRTYFHKAFKKQYGMTPAEYRQKFGHTQGSIL